MSGPLESSITLEEVFAVVSAKRVPLAPELAGYLVLEIAEGAGIAPGEVDPRQVYIGDEGTVALVRQKRADANGDMEESIRALLQRLLDASGSQTPALDAAAKRAAGGGVASLSQELESALVPVNRAAGRRALARLAREVKRVTLGVGRNASVPPESRGLRGSNPSYPGFGRGSADERPSGGLRRKARPRDEVDSLLSAFEVEAPRPDAIVSRDLKEMAGLAGLTPTPPPPRGPIARTPAQAFPPSTRDPERSAPISLSVTSSPSSRSGSSSALSPPASLRRPGMEAPRERRGSSMVWLVVGLLLVLVVGAAILAWIFRSGSSRSPASVPTVRSSVDPTPSASAARRVCKATVVVTDAPPNAELLVRTGQAPLDVLRMPVGARLEFVATSDGYAPKRAVIPARATWDAGAPGKPRYEMTVELDRSRAKPGSLDPWPPGEPGSEVGGHGAPGIVHVSSTPRGAEIWLLTGLGPEASIDQLPCDADVDVLVAGPSTFRKRLHIAQGEFTEVAAPAGELARKARVSAK